MMPNLNMIVAVARGGAIGRGGDLLFHISPDLKRFKALTMGCPIVMGRRTFESFPRGPLPGRRNIVITRSADYPAEGIELAATPADALALCADAERVFVIGGGQVYAALLPQTSTLHITEIDAEVPDADTFFPTIDPAEWALSDAGPWQEIEGAPRFRFLTYTRR